jgi:hypothetical protein
MIKNKHKTQSHPNNNKTSKQACAMERESQTAIKGPNKKI